MLKDAGRGLRPPGSCSVRSSSFFSAKRSLRFVSAWSLETNSASWTCGSAWIVVASSSISACVASS
jgi:hypothetical protein